MSEEREQRQDKPRRPRRRRNSRSGGPKQHDDSRKNQGGSKSQSNQTGQSGQSNRSGQPDKSNRSDSSARRSDRQRRGQQGRGKRDNRKRSGGAGSGGKLRVLVIGSGAREHALVWKLSQSQKVGKIYAIPGNSGMADLARCVDMKLDRTRDIAAFAARNNIDLTVVGPEAPLAAGIVDEFNKRNLHIFGPTKAAARLESSKAYAKEFMRRYGIPTASFRVFDNPNEAVTLCRTAEYPLVIKADGLAAGKGVIIVDNFNEALSAIKALMIEKVFGAAGKRILVEDFITGPEVSIMGFCDGEQCWPMVPSQDHKRIGEGDTGPNTGGMGAYAPAPFVTAEMMSDIQERVLNAVVTGMAKDGHPYKGVIYAGLMITEHGPKVIEFNCRFGDPEAEVVLPLLESDLADILLRIARRQINKPSTKKNSRRNSRKKDSAKDSKESEGEKPVQPPEHSGPLYLRDMIDHYPPPEDEELQPTEEPAKQREIRWSSEATAAVVIAAGGYPAKPERGKKIRGLANYSKDHCQLFHAGIKKVNDSWVTSGGRVLSVTGQGENLREALKRAYSVVERISFPGMQFRRDIGHQVLEQQPDKVVESD